MHRNICAGWLAVLCLLLPMTGCAKTSAPTESAVESAAESQEVIISAPADKTYIFTDNAPVFSLDKSFYNASISVELKTANAAEIYYTEDGSEPDKQSTPYTDPIYYACENTNFPTAHTIKAKAYYPDGTESAVSVHTYFAAIGADSRFSEYVFSLSGDPALLTEEPDGIFTGKNFKLRGRESERQVHLSAWGPDGSQILGQYCGVRIYGGGSRENSIKSMKLFARKSYPSGLGSFRTDLFQTPVEDGSGDVVEKYDKLVLRSGGNDFQFAFIRDELCQMLAKEAGFTDYENLVPAVAYLNGDYYGLFWLHESYCDDYFKEKYPNPAAMGQFVVIEGTDTEKDVEEDDEDSIHAEDFNAMYAAFSTADLTDDAVYAALCEQMDVENYLDYFAFNIYINNRDWPQNNFRCYRYCLPQGEAAGEGVYDGKWRFLLHDMDYSMGMYEQDELKADYNVLSHILKEGDERHSPLFAALMERGDCRTYFAEQIHALADGVLDGEHIKEVCSQLNGSRYVEMMKFYTHLDNLRNAGDRSIWAYSGHLSDQLRVIQQFAERREEHMLAHLEEALLSYEEETTGS